MENLYDYIIENFELNITTKRILDSIVIWAGDHYEENGTLTEEGIHFIETVIADNIGMDRQEIIKNWR